MFNDLGTVRPACGIEIPLLFLNPFCNDNTSI